MDRSRLRGRRGSKATGGDNSGTTGEQLNATETPENSPNSGLSDSGSQRTDNSQLTANLLNPCTPRVHAGVTGSNPEAPIAEDPCTPRVHGPDLALALKALDTLPQEVRERLQVETLQGGEGLIIRMANNERTATDGND